MTTTDLGMAVWRYGNLSESGINWKRIPGVFAATIDRCGLLNWIATKHSLNRRMTVKTNRDTETGQELHMGIVNSQSVCHSQYCAGRVEWQAGNSWVFWSHLSVIWSQTLGECRLHRSWREAVWHSREISRDDNQLRAELGENGWWTSEPAGIWNDFKNV